jgi:hypothetical protein
MPVEPPAHSQLIVRRARMPFQKFLAIGLHETLTRNAMGQFYHLSTLGVVHSGTFHLRRTSSLHNEEDGP